MKTFRLLFICLLTWYSNAQILGSMTHGGISRTYTYYKPTTWSAGQQLPLLVVLHGLTQTGAGVMDITQFNQIAESNNFIVCYPDGINNAWNANMNVTVSTADDKGFIESLVQYFQTNFNTNPFKQYLCGFSNGGFMSHKMACESFECFAAIATVSGNMSDTTFANCNPQFSQAVLHIHGTSDAIVPYNGSSSTGVSVDQTMQKWATVLNCNPTSNSVSMPNTSLTDFSSPERITYSNCANPLELIKITGGGHQWPGISTLVGGAGTINMDFYSPEVIWNFLSTNSCQSAEIIELENTIFIYPNPSHELISLKNIREDISVDIEDLNGRVLFSQEVSNSNSEISVNHLSCGYYFLNVQFKSNSNLNRKLIFYKN